MAVRKISPAWHYISDRQSELWRAVAAAHAPSGSDSDPVALAYQEMFDETATELSGNRIQLIGLGAGSGQKECRFAQALKDEGCVVDFTAVDVSEGLASEAAREVGCVIDGGTAVLVEDFQDAGAFEHRLSDLLGERYRVFTGFGLSPNLLPDEFFPRVRSLLDADESAKCIALVSANLWPNGKTAERELLPQYDNSETRQWLGQLFVDWGMSDTEAPDLDFCIGEIDGIAAVQVFATWPEVGKGVLEAAPSMVKDWCEGDRIEIFSSLRYTMKNFTTRAEAAGMNVRRSLSSKCGREGIFRLENGSAV